MLLQNSIILCMFSLLVVVYSKKLPSFVEVCPRHPQVGDCIRKNIENIRQQFCKGVPSLFIPSFNPFKIPQATLEGANDFKVTFNDIEIYDAEKFVLEEIDFNTQKWDVKFSVFFQRLRIKSNYNVKGRLLVLQLDGSGPADGNFTGIRTSIAGHLTPFEKDGKKYFKLHRDVFDLELGQLQLQFDKLFGDNDELTEQTNKLINENSNAILVDLQPVIKEVIFKFVIGIISNLFDKYSIDELFPLP